MNSQKIQFQKIVICFLTVAFIFSGCKKDESDFDFQPTSFTKISVVGTICSTDNKILPGTTVKLGSYSAVADDHGIFLFENIYVPDDRMVFMASKDGYFDCIYGKRTEKGTPNYVRLVMEEKGTPFMISATTGGTVQMTSGAEIDFPANAFVDAQGNLYNGQVSVYTRHIYPGDDDFESRIPGGDLQGIDQNNDRISLYSFGMIEAVLTDGANKLKLANGVTAQLTMPIDPAQAADAQNTIPLWHLDETTGLWIEEGFATKNGNSFVGNVSHFSTWNCDYPGPRADITGKVVDCNGNPVAGITVTINGFLNVVTNNNGIYTTWVPAGWPITYQVLAIYNSVVITNSPMVTFTATGGTSNVIPLITISCLTRVSGNIKNCNGTESSPGMVYFNWNGGSVSYYSNNGVYENVNLPPNTTISLYSYYQSKDYTNSFVSGDEGIEITVSDIYLCQSAESNSENFSFKIIQNGSFINYIFHPYINGFTSNYGDWDGDGVYDFVSINISGFITPTNKPCYVMITLMNSINNVYPLTTGIQNNQSEMNILIDSINFVSYMSGYAGNTTGNKFTVLDYGEPGGYFKAVFEYDFDWGLGNIGQVTNGSIYVRRD